MRRWWSPVLLAGLWLGAVFSGAGHAARGPAQTGVWPAAAQELASAANGNAASAPERAPSFGSSLVALSSPATGAAMPSAASSLSSVVRVVVGTSGRVSSPRPDFPLWRGIVPTSAEQRWAVPRADLAWRASAQRDLAAPYFATAPPPSV